MPLVRCQHTDCIHCDLKNNFKCKAYIITIGDDWCEGCSAYEDYLDQPDYQNEHWIVVMVEPGKAAKAKQYYGKRIEYEGRVFYTRDRIEDPVYCNLTDAETGRDAGSLSCLAENFAQICVQAQKFPKVETLPEAEWTRGGYELVKEAHHD